MALISSPFRAERNSFHLMGEQNREREKRAIFRFYAELNDFLPFDGERTDREYQFKGKPSVKDAIEAQGVPHPEVELILVNGEAVGFDYSLREGDRVAVYPLFETLDIRPLVRLRQAPLRDLRFVVDINLGKLARWLRFLGYDTVYRNDFADAEVVAIAMREKRVVLTRDRRLLHHKLVTHGYWVRSDKPDDQIVEMLHRFQLEGTLRPFRRCLKCNGCILRVEKEAVLERLPPKTRIYYNDFFQCDQCRKVYWKGPHYERLLRKLQDVGVGNSA